MYFCPIKTIIYLCILSTIYIYTNALYLQRKNKDTYFIDNLNGQMNYDDLNDQMHRRFKNTHFINIHHFCSERCLAALSGSSYNDCIKLCNLKFNANYY